MVVVIVVQFFGRMLQPVDRERIAWKREYAERVILYSVGIIRCAEGKYGVAASESVPMAWKIGTAACVFGAAEGKIGTAEEISGSTEGIFGTAEGISGTAETVGHAVAERSARAKCLVSLVSERAGRYIIKVTCHFGIT